MYSVSASSPSAKIYDGAQSQWPAETATLIGMLWRGGDAEMDGTLPINFKLYASSASFAQPEFAPRAQVFVHT